MEKYKFFLDYIEKAADFQQKYLALQEAENLMLIIHPEFLENKDFFRTLFIIILSSFFAKRNCEGKILKSLDVVKDYIKKFITPDELLSVVTYPLYFVRLWCFEKGLTTLDAIKKRAFESPDTFLYFSPEIYENFPQVYIKLCIFFSFPPQSAEELEEFKIQRKNLFANDAFSLAIREDDVERLQILISNENIDTNKYTFPSSISEIYYFPKGKAVKMINFAALFGSIKCFKFLILNGCKIGKATANSAISGGNYEIIHFLENEHVELTAFMDYAVRSFQYDILNYLMEWKGVGYDEFCIVAAFQNNNFIIIKEVLPLVIQNPNIIGRNGYSLLDNSHSFKNIVIDFLLSIPGINVNLLNDKGGFPLFETCCDDVLIYSLGKLLEFPEIDINRKHANLQITSLMQAVNRRSIKCIKLLVENSQIDVNFTNYRMGLIQNAFMFALSFDFVEATEVFLNVDGIDITGCFGNYLELVKYAVKCESWDCINIILKRLPINSLKSLLFSIENKYDNTDPEIEYLERSHECVDQIITFKMIENACS